MNKDLSVWCGALIRGAVVVGITFFSTAIANGMKIQGLEASLIAGGLYMFAELLKYYKITMPTSKKAYTFLLLPQRNTEKNPTKKAQAQNPKIKQLTITAIFKGTDKSVYLIFILI